MRITRLLTPILALAFAGGCATPPRSGTAPRSAPPQGTALDLAVLDQVPVARHLAKPDYPRNLQEKGITGQAVIGFIVDTDGNVRDAWVIEETHKEFGEAAWQAVSQWKFRPGRKDGRNVNVRMKMPVVFNIQDQPRPAPPPDLKSY